MKISNFTRTLVRLTYAWRIIYPLIYLLIIQAIGSYAFIINDQGRDFFVGVVSNDISLVYILKTGITLFILCLFQWYSARIILQVKPLDVPSTPYTIFLMRWLPRLVGILPIIMSILALLRASQAVESVYRGTVISNILALLLVSVALMLFFVKRAELARTLNIDFSSDEQRFTTGRTSIRILLKKPATRKAMQIILLFTTLMLLMFFTPMEWGYARFLQPATIVITGLIFFTFLSSLTAVYINLKRSPLFLLIGGYILFASTCNNNNEIRTLASSPSREMLNENFGSWIRNRENSDTANTYPIVIVAAEGGGIRAAAWTALVLKKLEDEHPGFTRHIYAISGVSGGGVGATFYSAWWRDKLSGRIGTSGNLYRAVTADFLSDVTAAFLFHDNLQRVLPFPLPSLSRNRKLEDSWGMSYCTYLQCETMNEGFLSLWKDSLNLEIPNLFINGLLAETGQKAITTNLQLPNNAGSPFADDLDVMNYLRKDLPLKTAASLGARFPIITSGALLSRPDGKALGHILDGGYKDNSGIETAWQIALTISPILAKIEKRSGKSFPIHILAIRNGNNGLNANDPELKAFSIIPDMGSILPGFLNAWDRRTTTYTNITRNLFSGESMNERFSFQEIRLRNPDGSLPLGWYLSDAARQNILEQVKLADLLTD